MAMTTNNSINVKPFRRGKMTFDRRGMIFMVGNYSKNFAFDPFGLPSPLLGIPASCVSKLRCNRPNSHQPT
jgi:hypothetical protein